LQVTPAACLDLLLLVLFAWLQVTPAACLDLLLLVLFACESNWSLESPSFSQMVCVLLRDASFLDVDPRDSALHVYVLSAIGFVTSGSQGSYF